MFTSEDYDFCMQTNVGWLLVAIPLTLVIPAVPEGSFAQSSQPSAIQRAPVRTPKEDDDWTHARRVLQSANSWRTGDTLPLELRQFRESKTKEPNPMDSWDLITGLNNLPLLAALVADPGADPECREDALSRGIEVGGPTRFFGLLRPQLPATASESFQPWIRELRDRMSRPYSVVNALVIPYQAMSQKEALAVIARITGDLRRGAAWPEVYQRYSEEFSYPPRKNGDSTKIGLLGRLVVFPDPELGTGHMAGVAVSSGGSHEEVDQWKGKPLPTRLWGMSRFDPAHLPTLLQAKVGDVISLRSELNREYVLYQVEEIYKGEVESPPH